MALVKEFEIVVKREEIREGIARYFYEVVNQFCWDLEKNKSERKIYYEDADQILKFLGEQGVVIKTDNGIEEII